MSSVFLGIVADLFEPSKQQNAVAFVVLSSCAGSVVAPIAGGFISTYLSWQWAFWVSLIFGGISQIMHCFVPETRSSIMLDRHAKQLRKTGDDQNAYGPNEIRGTFWQRISWKESCKLMWRPYKFLMTEPIVMFLSLLSGFSDALIFSGLDSYGTVLQQWDFTKIQIGLSFFALLIGYLIAYGSFLPVYRRDRKIMRTTPGKYTPEHRLWWLLYLVLLEPIGLFGYAWAATGPPVPWIVPQIFSAMIGIANLAIYQATIDYMVAAYGPYSASATGGNGFCRDFLAGMAALYTKPLYKKIMPGTKWQLPIPAFILCGIGALLCIPVFVFYFYGQWFRERSPYAKELDDDRKRKESKREQAIIDSGSNTPTTSRPTSREQSPSRIERQ